MKSLEGKASASSSKVLDRLRIVDRIASAADAPITAIIAPGGYGKSTALRQFIERRREPTILFGVRPDDDSLVAFARGLIQSSPMLTQAALPTLHDAYGLAAQSADPGQVLAEWLAIFVADLPSTSLIAIDDLHFGCVDANITRFVAALIDTTKQRVRWVVSSRSWRDLPIDVWLAQGDMELPVDEGDLELTPDEIRELAALGSSQLVDSEVVQLLTAELEGWPTALVLALKAGIAAADFPKNSGQEKLFAYLVDRFFEGLAREELDFLKVASLLRNIDEELFAAAGFANVHAFCEQLADAGVLVPYGTDASLRRIHDLFTSYVEELRERESPDTWRGIAKRLCSLLDGRGDVNAAVALCIKLQDSRLANDIVRRRGLQFWDVLDAELVDKTVALIQSDPTFKPDPVFLAVRAVHVFRSGNVTEGKRQLLAALMKVTDPVTRSRIGARLTIGSMMSGSMPEGVQPFMFDVARVQDAGALSEIAGALGLVLAMKGEYRKVRDVIDSTIQRLSKMPEGDLAKVHYNQWAGFASWIVGDLDESREFERSAVRDGIETGRPAVSVFGYTLLIRIGLDFGDDLGGLNEYVEERRRQERRAGYVSTSDVSTLQGLICAIAAGDDAASAAIEQELHRGEMSEIAQIFIGQACRDLAIRDAWNGDFGAARERVGASRHFVAVRDEVLRFSALAMYSAAAGDKPGALTALKTADQMMKANTWFQTKGHQLLRNASRVYAALALVIIGEDKRAQSRLLEIDGFTGPLFGGMKVVAGGLASHDIPRVNEGLAVIKQLRYLGYSRMLEQVIRCVARTRGSGKIRDEA